MGRLSTRHLLTLTSLLAVIAVSATLSAQTTMSTATIGTVRFNQAVVADGKALPAGTYQVRLTTVTAPPVVGQTPAAAVWVEFMQGTAVAGREVATIVSAEDMRIVQDRPRGGGAVRLQLLKGGDYLRVWILHAGQHVLIHLPVSS